MVNIVAARRVAHYGKQRPRICSACFPSSSFGALSFSRAGVGNDECGLGCVSSWCLVVEVEEPGVVEGHGFCWALAEGDPEDRLLLVRESQWPGVRRRLNNLCECRAVDVADVVRVCYDFDAGDPGGGVDDDFVLVKSPRVWSGKLLGSSPPIAIALMRSIL